ncbi:MAG: hypothetical protein AOA65_1015 [Candidatus Bathyarchaeota archaeon BA1]|nr:MAG: hypothetical protein AOA65_1015 [Candidatus Bathyarchaeota archaeon BA1]
MFIFAILNSKIKRNKIKIERKLQIDVFICYQTLMNFHQFPLVVL